MNKLTFCTICICCLLLLGGSSQATTISGSLWVGPGAGGVVTNAAINPALGTGLLGIATTTFTVTNLDFDSRRSGTSATYDQFLSNGGANGLSAYVPVFNGAVPIVTGATTASFFQFTWTTFIAAGTVATITHDDGVYLKATLAANPPLVFDFSTPSNPADSIVNIAAAGTYSFVLNYGSWNGFPEVLTVTSNLLQTPPPGVPEPTSILLLGIGLIGLAELGRKLRS